jgi:hypothetical protein
VRSDCPFPCMSAGEEQCNFSLGKRLRWEFQNSTGRMTIFVAVSLICTKTMQFLLPPPTQRLE